MQATPYKLQQQGKVVVEVSQLPPKSNSLDQFHRQNQENLQKNSSESNNNSSRTTSSVESEPTSTLSSSNYIAPGVADPELHHRVLTGSGIVPGGGEGGTGIGLEEWDSLFPNGDGALLTWIMGDPVDRGLGLKNLMHPSSLVGFEGNAGLGIVDQVSGSCGVDSLSYAPSRSPNHLEGSNDKIGSGSISPNCVPPNGFNLNPSQLIVCGGKPKNFNPQFMMNQQAQSFTNPCFLISPPPTLDNFCHQLLEQFQPQSKRHNPCVVFDPHGLQCSKNLFIDPHHEMLLRKQQRQSQMGLGLPPQLFPHQVRQTSLMMPQFQLQEQGVKEQFFKAAELIQTGNFSLTQEILARLNHQLSIPAKPPLVRAALLSKEALQVLLQLTNPVSVPPPKMLNPYDIVHKMDAYEAFSEVSPFTQFVNFTCTQAILEALDDAHTIHVVDFDIGCGAQWASLIQELPLRKMGAPSLRITVVAPPTTHSFELALIRENLVQFANDNGIAFEFQVLNLDSFDPSSSSLPNFRTSEDECIAVSLPIWSSSTRPSLLPSILRFIRESSPKVVVSLDKGFDCYDVPFPQHLIHSLESCTNLLESLDGLNVVPDIVSKVEKFFIQPRIENSVLGRLHTPNKMPHWKNLFSSAGLKPLQFSNFTETQADYVVKRTPGRGFHVEMRQASLVLSWQRRELVSVSVWRC